MGKYYITEPTIHFLSDDLHQIPAHAQELSESDWQNLLNKQSEGFTIEYNGSRLQAVDKRANATTTRTSPAKFFAFFTEAEEETLGTAALTNHKLFMWLTKLPLKPIELQSDNFNQGIALLLAEKVLTSARKTELFKYLGIDDGDSNQQ